MGEPPAPVYFEGRPMKSMGDPDYEYRPRSDEQRQKQNEAQRARLGIPEGHSRVYGIHVPDSVVDTIRPLAAEVARKQGFDAAHAFVARASANEWRIEAAPAPAAIQTKAGGYWTPERRKAASEAAKARHAARRAQQQAKWEQYTHSAEYRLQQKLNELRQRHERALQVWRQTKAAIEELEAAQKLLDQARTALRKYGLVE